MISAEGGASEGCVVLNGVSFGRGLDSFSVTSGSNHHVLKDERENYYYYYYYFLNGLVSNVMVNLPRSHFIQKELCARD